MSLDINLTGVEKTSNKKTTLTDNSDTFYPSQKAVKTAVDAKENTITAGTTAQYFRGDKTFQTLDKTAVGLSNVDNTSDANKPVSTATQTALNNKVDKVTGKGLSTEDYTTAEKSKLAGIQAGAEVNVNADWNATSGDAQILNKPTIPNPADFVAKSDFTSHSILAKQSGASDPVAVSIGNNEILGRKSGGGSNIEGLSVSEVKSLLNYTASDVGAVATNSVITGATKTKISYDAKGLVTSGADATTADIADSSNKRYVTDANLVVIGNTSGTNTGDETQSSILAKLGFYILKSLTSGATVTGTAENIVGSFDVGSSKFSASDNFNFDCDFVRGTRLGSCTLRAYLAPNSGNLTGATLIATGAAVPNSGGYIANFLRIMKIKSGNLEGFQFSRAVNNQNTTDSTVAYSSTPFDVTSTRYLIVTSTFTSAGDTGYLNSMTIKNF
jgi:hypothetical protein